MSATVDRQQEPPFTDEELIRLKELAGKPERKWWADYPFLVSLLAFLLSLATALISAYESHLRDIHDQQAQLTTALASIQEVNLKSIEIHEKYKSTPYEAQAAALINAEINSTLRTAADLGLRLGTNATTAALSGIAQGLYGLGDNVTAEKLLRFALAAAQTANDESVALTYLGFLKLRNGRGGADLKEGEDYYSQALNLDHKYELSGQPLVVAWLRASAQLGWAEALAPVDCTTAQKHFGDAVIALVGAPADNIDFEQARGRVRQEWSGGIGGVPSCRPDPATSRLP
jgi:hypothetical protein